MACGAGAPSGTPTDTGPTTTFTIPDGHYPNDATLRFNHVQARGTHNSTHIEPEVPFDPSHEYTHLPLSEQLDLQGVRQFELDLHYKVDEGIEVFHLPLIDDLTTCLRFVDCLEEMKQWANDNPLHTPIQVWMELKDDVDEGLDGYDTFDTHYQAIEDEILSVLPLSRILTPDDVRGTHATLPQAITGDGWPTLGFMRGRFVFTLLEGGEHRDNYLAGRDNLADALMFVDADSETDPWAAMFKINDADGDFDRVQDLVGKGFMVTCNSDGADNSADHNTAKAARSLDSGAHYLSSDRPAADSGGDGFWLQIPDGDPARCNPVSAPDTCTSADIEALP
jgi:hypothetical protein